MKKHIEEASTSDVSGPGKEGLYARSTPMSPPHHIINTGPPNLLPNVLHLPSGNLSQSQLPGSHHTTVSYPKESPGPAMTPVQYQYSSIPIQGKNNPVHPLQSGSQHGPPIHLRHKIHPGTNPNMPNQSAAVMPGNITHNQNFQRLKVEDALSYLDQVKYKFGNQPQVYNDFLDIMKEFKSQSIDTPGVIQRVSNLFKGHPELIVGFNTFLPPGYKIEVQSNEQGYAFQVSVSMPSPTTSTSSLIQTTHHSISGNMGETITFLPSSSKHANITSHMGGHGAVSPPQPSTLHYQPPQQSVPQANSLRSTNNLSPAPNQMPLLQQQSHINSGEGGHVTPQNQPVEFNHAINYVNKIKNRFQGQPDKYKRFLEILHTYQKEQRNIKEGNGGPGKHLTEAEVYSQVSKLFEHQEDLLAEFGQFLPDATSHLNTKNLCVPDHPPVSKKSSSNLKSNYGASTSRESSYLPVTSERESSRSSINVVASSSKQSHSQLKRSASFSSSTIQKKHKMASLKDVSLYDASKYCSLSDYAFFDKIRNSLKNPDVYENFLRCLYLYNQELMSKVDLVQTITPFLARFPELLNYFKEFVGFAEPANTQSNSNLDIIDIAPNNLRQGELAMDIDYSSCKRLGASYCALPKTYMQPKCSGRTPLCKEVLNDTWVSFPSWSEDSTFVTSRKTQYEEYIYRCEDERFELDVVITTNHEFLRLLEYLNRKLSRMSTEEANKFRLDENLGGSCSTVALLALRRLYGDKANEIMESLKKSPAVAVPVILKRVKAKDEEWREAQKGLNKGWREQNEKYYLKSLDHQGINFKQTDLKALRSKNLFNEIETILDERHEPNEDGADVGPHLTFSYVDKTILDDASNLLIHHVKRLSGIHKDDKHKMKVILRHFVPDLFHHTRQELSDDEKEDDKEDDGFNVENPGPSTVDEPNKPGSGEVASLVVAVKPEIKKEIEENSQIMQPFTPGEYYTMFMANNNWYLFLRLHQILCERLAKMHKRAEVLVAEEIKERESRPAEPISEALRLKKKLSVNVEDFYPTLLDMVRNVLDGNMECNAFEDALREMFTIHAYIAFTMDKVVTYAVRQLQHIVTDEIPQDCIKMYRQEQKRGGGGGLCATAIQRINQEVAYQKKFEQALSDENCFKIFIYKLDCKITFELLDNDTEEPEVEATTEQEPTPEPVPEAEPEKWSNYGEGSSVKPEPNDPNMMDEKCLTLNDLPRPDKPVVLPRNIRSWRKIYGQGKGGGKHDSDDDNNMADEDEFDDEEGPSESGNTPQCKFDLNAYKVLFVINKENFIYKKNCFTRAKDSHPGLSKVKNNKFKKWKAQWVAKNVSDSELEQCTDWLMGKGSDTMPNKTEIVADNDINKPPYAPYNRYLVSRLE